MTTNSRSDLEPKPKRTAERASSNGFAGRLFHRLSMAVYFIGVGAFITFYIVAFTLSKTTKEGNLGHLIELYAVYSFVIACLAVSTLFGLIACIRPRNFYFLLFIHFPTITGLCLFPLIRHS